jgi:hypothetical protein
MNPLIVGLSSIVGVNLVLGVGYLSIFLLLKRWKENKNINWSTEKFNKEIDVLGYANELRQMARYMSTSSLSCIYYYLDSMLELGELSEIDSKVKLNILRFVAKSFDEDNVGFRSSSKNIKDDNVPSCHNDLNVLGILTRLLNPKRRKFYSYSELEKFIDRDEFEGNSNIYFEKIISYIKAIREDGCKRYLEDIKYKISSIEEATDSDPSNILELELAEISTITYLLILLHNEHYLRENSGPIIKGFLDSLSVGDDITKSVYAISNHAKNGCICGTYFGFQIWRNCNSFENISTSKEEVVSKRTNHFKKPVMALLDERYDRGAYKTQFENIRSMVPLRHALWLIINLGIDINELEFNINETKEFIESCKVFNKNKKLIGFAYFESGIANIHAMRCVIEISNFSIHLFAQEQKEYFTKLKNDISKAMNGNYFDHTRLAYKGIPADLLPS